MPEEDRLIENFKRIAPNRMELAIKAIRSIGNLGNPNYYKVDDHIAAKMIIRLYKEIKLAESNLCRAIDLGDTKYNLGGKSG